jgi:hypothetical protein
LPARSELGKPISRTTVQRILVEDAIKPWQYEHWIFPRAPDFFRKAAVVLDLYEGRWDDQPGPGTITGPWSRRPNRRARWGHRHRQDDSLDCADPNLGEATRFLKAAPWPIVLVVVALFCLPLLVRQAQSFADGRQSSVPSRQDEIAEVHIAFTRKWQAIRLDVKDEQERQ